MNLSFKSEKYIRRIQCFIIERSVKTKGYFKEDIEKRDEGNIRAYIGKQNPKAIILMENKSQIDSVKRARIMEYQRKSELVVVKMFQIVNNKITRASV